MNWRFFSPTGCSREQPDCFDVFDAKQLASLSRERDEALTAWSAEDAGTSVDGAARFALGLLRRKRGLRQRFPAAISAGESGNYCQWLIAEGAKIAESSAAENIRDAFRLNPGRRVLDLFLHSPDLQKRFPHGLLTAGQKKFVRWLLREGRERYGITSAEVLWFLHVAAERTPEMISFTWRINPEWQKNFPRGLTSHGSDEFVGWLRTTFAGCPGFSKLPSLPTNTPKSAQGANVISHFCYPSGIQQAALNIKAGLESAGWQTSCRDVPTSPATDLLDRRPFLDLEAFPITITNVAPAPHFQDAYERAGLLRRDSVYRVAYWAWELDEIPEAWLQLAPSIDEIWAPSAFVAEAFRKRMPVPVFEMLPGLRHGEIAPITRSSLGIAEENYVFLFVFDMSSQMERKNPLAVIRAYRAAFAGRRDVTLVLKISRGASKPHELAVITQAANEAGALVVDAVVSHAEAYGFIEMCDCFVSLHRSEGFGLCLAEAMLLGKPVIATNYSGNLAFMHTSNSLLVDYRLIALNEDFPPYPRGNHWADPSLDHAVAHLRFCYENRSASAAIGAVGQGEIREKFSLEAMGQRMAARLAQIGATPR